MWTPQGLYSKFVLKQPTLLFGTNSIYGLRNYPCSKIAVIYGKGLSNELKAVIEKAVRPLALKFIQKNWTDEPALNKLQDTIRELEIFKPDVIIAVGGGSVIDGSKIARLYYEFPFFDMNSTRFNLLEWKTTFIVIPSTVGSGAEISSAAVILNQDRQTKEMIVNHSLMPDVIILDPLYVKDSPEKTVFLSILDAISHIVEGYVSIIDNELVDSYAEKGLQNIYEVLSHNSELSLNDFSRLQFAGYLGGIVQNHCIVGAAHAIAHQLGGHGFGHAEAIAFVLTKVIEANSRSNNVRDRYETLSVRSGTGSVSNLLAFINSIKHRLNLSEREAEMKKIIFERINNPEFIENIQNDKGGKGNPIPLTVEYVKTILNSLK
jgi:alcohol dehydrogenase class IV